MGCPDVRDQSGSGLGNLTQLAYFTGMVGPISITPISCDRLIESKVSGTPMWLL